MNLCGINPHHAPPRRPLGDISVGNPYFGNYQSMEGNNNIDFDLNFIIQLDKVFQNNTMNFLSDDQKEFVNTFLYEAGKVNDALDKIDTFSLSNSEITEYTERAYDNISETMLQLDNVLSQLELPTNEEE